MNRRQHAKFPDLPRCYRRSGPRLLAADVKGFDYAIGAAVASGFTTIGAVTYQGQRNQRGKTEGADRSAA